MVIGTLKSFCIAETGWTQAIAAMLADVVKSPDAAVGLANDQYRLGSDFGHTIIAGLRKIPFQATDQPYLGPHAVPFEAHEPGVGITFLGDDVRAEVRVGGLVQRRAPDLRGRCFRLLAHAACLAGSSAAQRIPRLNSS